jgi:antitoxin component of RelBE/YafQ-DinJ toxin-antitoxin module
MGYLKQFAKEPKKGKGETVVLTARLPESLYEDFKGYCDSLGLSISEAINLLVEQEMTHITPKDENVRYLPVKLIKRKKP